MYPPFLLLVLEPRSRVFEVSGVRQAVRADGAQLGQGEVVAEELADPALDLAFHIDRKLDASWDDEYFFGLYREFAIERPNKKGAGVRDDEEVAVRIIKRGFAHGGVGTVCIDGDALLQRRLTCAQQRHQPLNEVDRPFLHRRNGLPSQLVRVVI